MKKLFISFCLLFMLGIGCVKAQTNAGNMMLGGGIGIESSKKETGGEDTKSSTITLKPSFGYFVADNFAVGLNLEFVSQKWDYGLNGDDKESEFLIGPFARYYKYTSNEKFAFFGEAGFLFGSGKDEPDGAPETKSSSIQVYIAPGFAYFFNEHWALDLQLQGISYRSEDPNTNKAAENDKQSEFNFGVDFFYPSLGFRYHF